MDTFLLQENGRLLLQQNSRGLLTQIVPLFLDPGSDATQDLSFYSATAGTVVSASDQSYTGPRSIKVSTGAGPTTARCSRSGVLNSSGRRISFRFRFDTLPTATGSIAALETSENGNQLCILSLRTDGKLLLRVELASGPSIDIGTTTLAVNTWYRIYVSYVINSASAFNFVAGVGGVEEVSLTYAGDLLDDTITDTLVLAISSDWGANRNAWYDDIYVDGGIDYSDPGDVRVTAKRPNANGTTNGFTLQIGVGGSGYGSGHSPQVNEQPLSTTNGWSMVGVGAAVTEEYNVENQVTGDVDLTGTTIVGVMGWVYAKALAPETAQLIVDGVSGDMNLTTSNKFFFRSRPTFPAGTGADVGMITSTDLTTVSLYEAGIVVAYLQ
jgi:hypothetical protein